MYLNEDKSQYDIKKKHLNLGRILDYRDKWEYISFSIGIFNKSF